MKEGIIYKATNVATGEVYIGATTINLKDRIENILKLCRYNKKIIPPTIRIHPQNYGLNLEDGGHRMFCAIELGQKTIPILIKKQEKELIDFILKVIFLFM